MTPPEACVASLSLGLVAGSRYRGASLVLLRTQAGGEMEPGRSVITPLSPLRPAFTA